jgi:hypothetical protein
MNNGKKKNGLWEKKQKVLSFRVGDTVIRQLSRFHTSGKRLSAARAARHVLEEFLNGRLVPIDADRVGDPIRATGPMEVHAESCGTPQ